jgi:hypothetical protein
MMGLIHSRASKKRDKAAAKLLKAQTKQVKAEAKHIKGEAKHGKPARDMSPNPNKPILLQPTVGAAISEYRRRRANGKP